MDVTWAVKYITEFLGTAFLVILGNGAVANVELKGTKGHNSGWIVIAVGYGMGVMIPALMFGNISGSHINPAFTIALAAFDYFPWGHVFPYVAAQFLGAIVGQLVVVSMYRPYYLKTENSNNILGSFSTISSLDQSASGSRRKSIFNGFVSEFFGAFVLFFSVLAMTKNYFGAEVLGYAVQRGTDVSTVIGKIEVGPFINASQSIAHLAIGFLVMALVTSLGGPSGPALNPARDLGPRVLHYLLPERILGKYKGNSKWWYAWVPVVSPILSAIFAVYLFQVLYG